MRQTVKNRINTGFLRQEFVIVSSGFVRTPVFTGVFASGYILLNYLLNLQ